MMDRLQLASARMSKARRQLIEALPEDDSSALEAAMHEVEDGLELIGDAPLPAPRARECVTALRSALLAPLLKDRDAIYAAIDDLASFLYWTEVYNS